MTSKEAIQELNNILWEEIPFSSIDNIMEPIERDIEVIEIIKEHKLLNYVIKNKKASRAYNLTNKQIEVLKELVK